MIEEIKTWWKFHKIKKNFWEMHEKYLPKFDPEFGSYLDWKVELTIKDHFDPITGKRTIISVKPWMHCSSSGYCLHYHEKTHKTYKSVGFSRRILIFDGKNAILSKDWNLQDH